MIKNVIFDIGNVLADFAWEQLFHRLGFEGETFEHMADATVRGPYWQEFDRGAMSDQEIVEGFYSLARLNTRNRLICFMSIFMR